MQITTKLFVALLLSIFLISFVSSALDITQNIVPITNDKYGYGEITLKDWFGLPYIGEEIFKGTIEEHTQSCSDDCYSLLKLNIKEGLPIYDSIKTYKIVNGKKITKDIPIKVEIRTNPKIISNPTYGKVCIDNENKTGQECSLKETGTEEVTEYEYAEITSDYKSDGKEITLKISGQKKSTDEIDWVITTSGESLDSWAVWGKSMSTSGLLMYYNLNEGSGTVGNDSLGVYNLTGYNTPVWTTDGKISKALNLTGVTQYMDSGWNKSGNYDISYSMWISSERANAFADRSWAFIHGGNSVGGEHLGVFYVGGTNNLAVHDGVTNPVFMTTAYPDGGWKHIVVAYSSAGNYKIYVNGSNYLNVTQAITFDNYNFTVGNYWVGGNPNLAWDGRIDEVSVWNRTLSQEDVNNLYNSFAGNTYPLTSGVVLNSPADLNVSNQYSNVFNITATATSPATLVNISFWNNKTGVWAIDSTAFKAVRDSSNGRYATLGNGVNLNGSEAIFDGTDDYIEVPHNQSQLGSNLSNGFTISAWINPRSVGEGGFSGIVLDKSTGYPGTNGFVVIQGGLQVGLSLNGGVTKNSAISSITYGQWKHVVMTITSAQLLNIYLNGVLSGTANQDLVQPISTITTTNAMRIGQTSGGIRNFDGSIRNVKMWNKVLNSTEIAQDYAGTFVNDGIIINCLLNDTIDNNGSTSIFTSTFPEGTYKWGGSACDSDGDCGASENRTITINKSISISLNSPADSYSTINTLNSFNCTAIPNNPATLVNISLWTNSSGWSIKNTTTISGEYMYSTLPIGNYLWGCSAVDSDGFIDYSLNRTIGIVKITENSVYYNTSSYETSTENFKLNATFDRTTYYSSSAYLWYNNVSYLISTSTTDGLNSYFEKSLIVPSTGNRSFFFQVILNPTTLYNTTTKYQNLLALTPLNISANCPVGTFAAFNFTFADEPTRLSNIISNVTYNLRYGYGNTTGVVAEGNFSNIPYFAICMNNSIPSYSVGYGEVQYETAGNTLRRFYIFENTRLTNTTTSVVLYSLANSLATSFLITAQDNNLNNYVDKYLTLFRWYPEINSYEDVEMGKTDDKGQTVFRVKTEDVDYRIGIYERDGTLIKLINPIRMVCLASPCSYSIFVESGSSDYTSYLGIESNLSYNNVTGYVTYIWNDPSQKTQSMNLTIYKETALTRNIICSTSGTGYTGVLVCNVSGQTGTLTANAFRTASPAQIIDSLTIWLNKTFNSIAGGNTIALFMTFLLVLLMALIGIYNPIAAMLLGIIGLIPAIALGSLPIAIIIGFSILGAVVFHMLRRI